MPHLIEFYNDHPELHDRFEILALHESRSVQTLAQLDEKNAVNERDIWKTRLPFPVLIDKNNQTVRRYGITGYPTLVLIDPQGRQVKVGSLDVLKEKLGVKDDPGHGALPAPPPQIGADQAGGSIVDQAGRPVANAEIARWALQRDGQLLPQGLLKADANGHFAWKMQPDQLPMTCIVFDEAHTIGASVKITSAAIGKPVQWVLKPLAQVRYTPRIEDDFDAAAITTSLGFPDMTAVVVQSYEQGPLLVPEGEYTLNLRSPDLEVFEKHIVIQAGQDVDLGPLDLRLSPAARNVGRPALPIDFAQARGVPADFSLDDLKGKWVLLEFWGFW